MAARRAKSAPHNPLHRAVIEAAVFLAGADDDTVDEDAAVAQLEQLAFFLGQLAPAEQQAIAALCATLADEAKESGKNKRADLLRKTPDALGLAG